MTWEFWLDRCSVKTISCCLFGRKVEIKKESEVWTSDSADFNNGGALEPQKNASYKRRFLLKSQRVMDLVYRGILEPFYQ